MLKLKPDVFYMMKMAAYTTVESNQADFGADIYHLLTTNDKAKIYLWLCRPGGTSLYPLPLDGYAKQALHFYIREQGYAEKIRFFKVTASELQELTIDQVKEMF